MIAVKDEFTSWVKEYTRDLYSYTISKINNKSTAEDIVQNTFLSALEAYAKFENRSGAKTWLFSILKNKIADYYRQRFKQVEQYSVQDGTDELFDENGRLKAPCSSIQWSTDEQLLDDPEFLQALHGCIAALPQKLNSVVALKYIDGKDSQQVCEKLDITKSNLWQIMHRAKLLLRTCLENKWFKTGNANR